MKIAGETCSVRKTLVYKMGLLTAIFLFSLTFTAYSTGISSNFMSIRHILQFRKLKSESVYFDNIAAIVEFRSTPLLVTRHVPIPKLIQNFWVLGFVVLGTALGFGSWVSFGFG